MGRPVFLADNLFNVRLYPDHVLSASEEASGRDVGQIGSGRRAKAQNHWTTTTANTAHYVSVACDRVRAADMLVLDRGHNLEGQVIRVRVSNDSFSTYTEIGPLTLPSQVFPFARLDQTPGVKTPEGAWLFRFGTYAGRYWRVVFDAMGSGLKPEVVNAQLGLAFSPAFPEVKPFTHGLRELKYEETEAPSAWVGAGQVSQRRRKHPHLRMASFEEYEDARYSVEELILKRRGTWVVSDDEQAEKAFYAVAAPQVSGFEVRDGWSYPQCDFELVEQEPKLI